MAEPTGAAPTGAHGNVAELGELLDQVAAGIIWFDGDGRLTWVNQGAHVLLKLPAFADPESELDRIVDIRDVRGRTIADLARAGRQGAPRGSWTAATITLADGTALAARIRLARRLHSLGGPDAIVVTIVDGGSAAPEEAGAPPDHPDHARRLLARLGITEREADVAILLLQGYRVGTIAAELHHSPHTIRNRLKRLFLKTGSRSQPELIATLRRLLDGGALADGSAPGGSPRSPGSPPGAARAG